MANPLKATLRDLNYCSDKNGGMFVIDLGDKRGLIDSFQNNTYKCSSFRRNREAETNFNRQNEKAEIFTPEGSFGLPPHE